MKLHTLILAAGEGKRMKSTKPKVLHQIGQTAMIAHTLQLAQNLNSDTVVVVTGHQAEDVENWVTEKFGEIKFVRQENQLGTGHAVKIAEKILPKDDSLLLVLYGDTPLISPETVKKMSNKMKREASLVVLGFEENNYNSYGKLVMSKTGNLDKIVEHEDANYKEHNQKLCNSGILLGKKNTIFTLLEQINSANEKSELYLTDIIEKANLNNLKVEVTICTANEAIGVNSMTELAKAEAFFQETKRKQFLGNGVTLIAPETVYFSNDTKIGMGSVIEPHVIFGTGVSLAENVTIRAFSYLEECTVNARATIGPFARLRPGSDIGENAKVGNFVEIKKSKLGEETKVSHLAYVGDTILGDRVNFGAGSIVCNYDGAQKHATEIGDDAFIGSNSSLVAPLKIGKQSLIGSGTVVTKNIPDKDLALSRTPQINKKHAGKKIMDSIKSRRK